MRSKFLLCFTLVLSGFSVQCCRAAVVFPLAPEEGRRIAIENVSELLRGGPYVFNGLQIKDMTITNCHAMYSVGPSDIVSGKLLSAAKLAAWTYLFVHETNAVAEVRLNLSPTNGQVMNSSGVTVHGLERVVEGTDQIMVESMFKVMVHGFERVMEGLRTAERLPQTQKQDYEFRFLACFSINFYAVWLHGKSDDIILPLPATYGRCNAYQPYSEGEMMKLLRPEAQRYIETWNGFDAQIRQNENIYTQAMMDYEKAHGGNCGTISYYGILVPPEVAWTNVEIAFLEGMSSKCGKVAYEIQITCEEDYKRVEHVEVVEKLPDNFI